MSVLTEAEYEAVLREIQGRAKFYHGQIGADVDWLLAQVHYARLGEAPREPSPTAVEAAMRTLVSDDANGDLHIDKQNRRMITRDALRAAYAVDRGSPSGPPPEGPWQVLREQSGWWFVSGSRGSVTLPSEAEALAVCDALNRYAAARAFAKEPT